MKFLAVSLLSLIGCLSIVQAGDHTLNDFKLGSFIVGNEAKLNDLKGKVVVIEFWGVQCPPCLAKMPHLVTLDQKYSDRGLRLIGAEMQRSSTSRIQSALKRSGATFPIVQGCKNPIGVNSLPHMAIFNVDGKLVYSGYPKPEADNIILKELERVTQPIAKGREIRIRPIVPTAG